MKKVFILLLTLTALLTFTGCGILGALTGTSGTEQPGAVTDIPAQDNAPAQDSSHQQDSQPTQSDTAVQDGATAQNDIANTVGLLVDKAHYDMSEVIEVTLDFSKLEQAEAVIAMIPSSTEFTGEAAVHDVHEEYRYLSDFDEIPFYMWAPEKDGLFDIRVYENSYGGKELACVTIAVGSAELPASDGE